MRIGNTRIRGELIEAYWPSDEGTSIHIITSDHQLEAKFHSRRAMMKGVRELDSKLSELNSPETTKPTNRVGY